MCRCARGIRFAWPRRVEVSMSHEGEVRIIHRHLRWEVSVRGVTRPIVDWSYSRERALEHAMACAREVGATWVDVEQWDGTVEERVRVDDRSPDRLSFVA